ncbi:hypothetical protein UlMin_013528 [Ulmus minor]
MEIDLSPKLPKKLYGVDGGSYYAWAPSELPMLRKGKVGAAKLALHKNGFALPRYSDSSKIAYVLQGNGVAGIVLPESNEKVIPIKKGDTIVGVGGDLVKLDGRAMCSPGFSSDSALQVTYIVRGSGRVQVVGVDGQRVLETTVKEGNFFVVPRFFVVSKIADPEGLEWFSIVTSTIPIFSQLGGKTRVWKALSPQVIEASFNVDSKIEKLFRSKRNSEEIFFPPQN